MTTFTNAEIQESISSKINENLPNYFPDLEKKSFKINVNPLEFRHWAYVFSIDVISNHKKEGVYIKIPRTNRSENIIHNEITKDDAKIVAEKEYCDLKNLHELFSSYREDLSVVKPLDFFKDLNAIITEKCFGDDIYNICRKDVLASKIFRFQPHTTAIFLKCGEWLQHYHRHFFKKDSYENCFPNIYNETSSYINFLQQGSYEHTQHLLGVVKDSIVFEKEIDEILISKNINGFQVRNFITENGKILFVDPGEIKVGPIYEDVARFIVTTKMIFWGTPLFLLGVKPSRAYIDSFLKGYLQNQELNPKLLKIFLIKHFLKQWSEGYIAIQHKRYPTTLKEYLRKIYIDRFFMKEVQLLTN